MCVGSCEFDRIGEFDQSGSLDCSARCQSDKFNFDTSIVEFAQSKYAATNFDADSGTVDFELQSGMVVVECV